MLSPNKTSLKSHTNLLSIHDDYFVLKDDVNNCINEIVVNSYLTCENKAKPKYILIIDRSDMKDELKNKIISQVKDINILSYNDTITNAISFDILITSLKCYHQNFYNGLSDLPVNGIICYIESPESFSTLISLVQYITINAINVPLFHLFYLSKDTCTGIVSFNKVLYDSEDTIVGYLPMMAKLNIFNRNIKLLPNEYKTYLEYSLRRLNWKVKANCDGSYERIRNDIKKYVSGTLCLSEQGKRVMTFVPVANSKLHSKGEYTMETIEEMNNVYDFIADFEEKNEAMLTIIRKNTQSYYIVLYSVKDETETFEKVLRNDLKREIKNVRCCVINIHIEKNFVELINRIKSKENKIKIIFYNILILDDNYLPLLLSTNHCECYQLFYYNSIEHDLLYAYYTCWYKTIKVTKEQIDLMNKRRSQHHSKDLCYEDKESDGMLIYDRNLFFYTKNGNFLFERTDSTIQNENFVRFNNEHPSQFKSEQLEINSDINQIKCRSLRLIKADELKDYLRKLFLSAKENSEKITELHSFLEKNGCIASFRQYILDLIMKRGFNFECFRNQMKQFTMTISEIFNYQFDSNIIRFYFEYFIVNLNTPLPNSVADSFLYFDYCCSAIKHKLLLIHFVLNVSGHDRRFLRTKVNVLLKKHKETVYKMLPNMSRENAKELELIGEGILILFEESFLDGFYDYERYIRKDSFVERIVSTIRIKRSQFYHALFGREVTKDELCAVMINLFNFVCGEILL